MRVGFLLWIALTLWACSGDKAPDYGAACTGGPTEGGCGTPCKESPTACASGLYCASDGFCHADCSTEREIACSGDGMVCAANGKCVDFGTDDDDDVCGNVKITGANVKPNTMLIVDQSGSMGVSFGSGSRWNVLRDLLIGASDDRPSGLVYDLQDQVRFGFATYSARAVGSGSLPDEGTVCPMLNNPGDVNDAQSILAFADTNYVAISDFYGPADMVDETPTGDAITLITEKIGNVDDYEDPVIFILATDGEPDRCEELNPDNGAEADAAKDEAIAAVTAAFALGIKTFVIAIGNSVSSDHAQDVAAAGQGLDPDDVSEELFYRPSTAEALEEDMQTIIRGERPCTFDIDGEIKDMSRVCEGSVRLFTEDAPDGRELTCDDPDGWRAVDADTVEIRGQACTDYRTSNSATIEGVFPCSVADGEFVF